MAPKQDTPVKMEEMDMPYIYYTLQEIPRDTFLKVEENYDSVRRETYDWLRLYFVIDIYKK